MIEGIQFLGTIERRIHYQVTAWGFDAVHRVFNEDRSVSDRFFCGGNECVFDLEGVTFHGFGGFLCEYMFGVEFPVSDIIRKDVTNRLVMFGAVHDAPHAPIRFTDRIFGRRSFDDIFIEGHAVCNYLFFVHAPLPESPEEAQRALTLRLGKVLKRAAEVPRQDDVALAKKIYESLQEPESTILLVRLIHLPHAQLYAAIEQALSFGRFDEALEQEFLNLTESLGIPRYQYERIKIDFMYKKTEHRHLIEEYRDILIKAVGRRLNEFEQARLHRIRTLSVRYYIPPVLFDTLDALLHVDRSTITVEDPPYIQETRAILESIFLPRTEIDRLITPEDLKRLLINKKTAVERRDNAFEEILLEIGRQCDEYTYQHGDERPFEIFSYIITYFDRFDATLSAITRLAYMESSEINEATLRSLIQNRRIFNELEPDFFEQLFIYDLYRDPYLTTYGRLKLQILEKGFRAIETADLSLHELKERVNTIATEEQIYSWIYKTLRTRQGDFYWDKFPRDEEEKLAESLWQEYRMLHPPVPHVLFQKAFDRVLFNLKKESIYRHDLLPEIIVNKRFDLREDFIKNSGLDRYTIEEIEREYFTRHGIQPETLFNPSHPSSA